MRKMRKFIIEDLGMENLECGLLECMDFQLCIEDFVQERSVDVIAMTTHHRNLLTKLYHPSLTRKILFQTEIPLLVFHAGTGLK